MTRNVPGSFIRRMSSWRRIATGTWGSANDPTIYGTLEIDVSNALEYIERLRDDTGEHVTITHVVTKAIANALAEHPECNAYVRLGRIYERDTIDAFVLVAMPPEDDDHDQEADLSGVKIRNADTKSLIEITRETRTRARDLRQGRDEDFEFAKGLVSKLPTPLLKLVLSAIEVVQYEFNIDLSDVGVPRDSFGAVLVTSVGMLGIQHAFPPLIPMTRLTGLVAVGELQDKPVAVDGEVVIRPMLPITATFDHRIIDGFQAAKLSKTFRAQLTDPELHFERRPTI
jgi:pyruvate dehydrogenase E2 component (dihydrolipoamide acetyltransferase)